MRGVFYKKVEYAPILSLFLIISVFIIAIVAVVYITGTDKKTDPKIELSSQSTIREIETAFKRYIDNCIKDVTIQSTGLLMIDGGQSRLKVFRDSPNSTFPFGKAYPLYYNYGIRKIPLVYFYNNATGEGIDLSYTEAQLAEQFADRINLSMPYCLNGFKEFTDKGIEITLYDTKTSAYFSGNIAKVKYYIRALLRQVNKTIMIDQSFDYKVNSDLKMFNNIIKTLVFQFRDPNSSMNRFPDFYLIGLSFRLNFKFFKSELDGSRILLTMVRDSNTSVSKYNNQDVVFNSIFQFNWSPYIFMDPSINIASIPFKGSKDFILEINDYSYSYYNNTKFSWDISSHFAGYNQFTIYSDLFSINKSTGMIRAMPIYPQLGVREFIVKAWKLSNMSDIVYGKFRVNITDPKDMPSLMAFNQSFAIRGFEYYNRIWAVGSQDRIPFYVLNISPELENMPCNGSLKIDIITGEMQGYVTAAPGDYNMSILVYQHMGNNNLINYVIFNTTLTVIGDYNLGCENR